MKSLKQSLELPTKSDLQNLLQTASVCLDTNALIHLFRYSKTTCDDWLGVLESIKDRLVLPNQVGIEFYRNLTGLPKCLENEYAEVEKNLNDQKKKLMASLEHARGRHPAFADKNVETKAKALLEQLDDLLNETKTDYEQSLGSSEQISALTKRVEDLFDKTTLPGFSQTKLLKIYSEGARRYEQLIPPGFEDSKQKQGYRKYGDFVIWKELLRYAKENHKSVIFVTADDKDDWWDGTRGKRTGPRQELRKEFHEKTGQEFYAYSPQQFLNLIQKLLEKTVSKEVFEETKMVSQTSSFGPSMLKHITELLTLDNSMLINAVSQISSSGSAWKSVTDFMATNPPLDAMGAAAAAASAAANLTGFQNIADVYRDLGMSSYWANHASARTFLEQFTELYPHTSIPDVYSQIIETHIAAQAVASSNLEDDDDCLTEDDQADNIDRNDNNGDNDE